MTKFALRLVALSLLLCASWAARAHDVPPSAVLLDIGAGAVNAELQLPLNELGLALSQDFTSNPKNVIPKFRETIAAYLLRHVYVETSFSEAYAVSLKSMQLQRIKDSDWLVANLSMQAPRGESTAVFALDYDVIIDRVVSHNAVISVRRDFRNRAFAEQPKMLGLLGFKRTHLEVNLAGGSWWYGFTGVFSLGMRHIAEGVDHLLFLLVLLLPAPLTAKQGRWRAAAGLKLSAVKILKVVSGFTLGHSLTLALGAMGLVQAPSRVIEVLIAVSIAVSASHAWRPMFDGKEIYIAAGFGLIHGLAFASALDGFGYDAWTLCLSLLGFNLGIETMQLAVVIAVLPWLVLLSGARIYNAVRMTGALFGGTAALAWIAERAFEVANPFAAVIDYAAHRAAYGAASLALFAITISLVERMKRPAKTNAGTTSSCA